MKCMKKWLPIVHPILFTLFFILALYAANANEVSPSEVVIPLIAAIGFALLLFFLAVLLIGLIRKLRKGQKSSQHYKVWDIKGAAIVASIFMVLFFTFGHALISIGEWDQMHRTLLPNSNFWITLSLVWIGLLAISIYLVVMTRRDLYKISIVLNILSFTLVIISTITILIYETNHTTMQVNKLSENMGNNTVDLVKPDPLPDIYYIVLDRYANARTLEEVYDYDNSEFINHLSDEGFYVANDSVSNYDHTDSSLISSLNMDFIQNAMAESPNVGNILDYRVWHYLKPNGYTFIHFG